jgi:hypothetical protein
MTEERIETLKEVKSRQAIWAEWMQKAAEGLKDNDKVISYTKFTPFGNFLIAFHPIK